MNGFWSWGQPVASAARWCRRRSISARASSRPPAADERVAAALELGADEGINYRRQDLTVEARRITGGAGVNVVADNIGDPDTFPKALAALGFQGRLVTAGGHGGGNVPLDVKYLYLNVITIFGNPIDTPDNFRLALKVAAEGKLKVLIDKVMPLAEARVAHDSRRGALGDRQGRAEGVGRSGNLTKVQRTASKPCLRRQMTIHAQPS